LQKSIKLKERRKAVKYVQFKFGNERQPLEVPGYLLKSIQSRNVEFSIIYIVDEMDNSKEVES
jgi:hypothetical protein